MNAFGVVKVIKFMFRWIPSTRNVAHLDSRNCGPAPSSSHHVRQSLSPFERYGSGLPGATRSDVIQSHSGKDKSIPRLTHSTARDPPANFSVSQPCSCIRVLVPWEAGTALPKTQDGGASGNEIKKRFLEETDTRRIPMELKLEDYVATTEGSGHDQGSMLRTNRCIRGGVKRPLVQRRPHRKGHWSGALASYCGSAWQGKTSQSSGLHGGIEHASAKNNQHGAVLRGAHVNQQASAETGSLTALGLLSDLWNGGSGAGDFLQPAFLTRLETVGRSKSSRCSSHVCTSLDHEWFRKDASVLAAPNGGET